MINTTEPIVRVRGLRKSFGKFQAVDEISFDIHRGQVVGFIGANGAGKTTTMRMMATLELPDSGESWICGSESTQSPHEVRKHLGWMPDYFGVYENVTVFDYLDFYARSYALQGAHRHKRLEEVMAFTELDSLQDRPMKGLSKGQLQRLCLGRTLLHDPQVLFLDEPAAGLDPKARIEFKNLVKILASQGKTLLISSHILSELEEMCDTMIFIDGGKLVHHGSSDSLKRDTVKKPHYWVKIVGDTEYFLHWVEKNPQWCFVDQGKKGIQLEFQDEESSLPTALKLMIQQDVPIIEFARVEDRLEDAFVKMIKTNDKTEVSS